MSSTGTQITGYGTPPPLCEWTLHNAVARLGSQHCNNISDWSFVGIIASGHLRGKGYDAGEDLT